MKAMSLKILIRTHPGDKISMIFRHPPFGPVTPAAYYNSKKISVADVVSAKTLLNLTRRKIWAFFKKYDLLLTPTTAQLPV